jgi:hypothetical protein
MQHRLALSTAEYELEVGVALSSFVALLLHKETRTSAAETEQILIERRLQIEQVLAHQTAARLRVLLPQRLPNLNAK